MIDPMNDAEVERMARAIYEELVANRHWDDVPLGDRDDFVHLLRRAMLSARPALSDGPNHIGDANEMVPALSTESGPRRPLLSVFPDVQGGALCIHGTRIPWEAIISFHDDGSSPAEIVREYPGLTEQQVRDVIAWRYPTPPTETER